MKKKKRKITRYRPNGEGEALGMKTYDPWPIDRAENSIGRRSETRYVNWNAD